jgi:hypothetical protein
VAGIHEGLQECMMEAQAIAADKITVAALGQLKKVYFSDSSYAEVVSQINLFYADPANAVIPVTQVYCQAVMKFKGTTSSEMNPILSLFGRLMPNRQCA